MVRKLYRQDTVCVIFKKATKLADSQKHLGACTVKGEEGGKNRLKLKIKKT